MSNSSDPNNTPGGGLQAMLARLKGVVQSVPTAADSPPPPDDTPAEEDMMLDFDEPDIAADLPAPEPVEATAPAIPLAPAVPLATPEPLAPAATIMCPVCGSPHT